MLRFLKFIPMIMMFKDVYSAYLAETGNPNKPFWATRRFIGSILALIGGAVAIAFGIVIDPATIDILAGNIEVLIGGAVALYGAVLGVVGLIKKRPATPVQL